MSRTLKRLIVGAAVVSAAPLMYFASWMFLASYDDLLPYVEANIEDFGIRHCPEDKLLLGTFPEDTFSAAFVDRLTVVLQRHGCEVVTASSADLDRYQQDHFPAPGERYSFIFLAGWPPNEPPKPWYTEISLGSNGGGLFAVYYWNGVRWTKRSEGVWMR